jgi:hypothetical protein
MNALEFMAQPFNGGTRQPRGSNIVADLEARNAELEAQVRQLEDAVVQQRQITDAACLLCEKLLRMLEAKR